MYIIYIYICVCVLEVLYIYIYIYIYISNSRASSRSFRSQPLLAPSKCPPFLVPLSDGSHDWYLYFCRRFSVQISLFFPSNRPDTSRGRVSPYRSHDWYLYFCRRFSIQIGQIPVVGGLRRTAPTTGIFTFVAICSFTSARYQSWERYWPDTKVPSLFPRHRNCCCHQPRPPSDPAP